MFEFLFYRSSGSISSYLSKYALCAEKDLLMEFFPPPHKRRVFTEQKVDRTRHRILEINAQYTEKRVKTK